jgi:hypothetical protein
MTDSTTATDAVTSASSGTSFGIITIAVSVVPTVLVLVVAVGI